MKKLFVWSAFGLVFTWQLCLLFVMWQSFLADFADGLESDKWVLAPTAPVVTVLVFAVAHRAAKAISEEM